MGALRVRRPGLGLCARSTDSRASLGCPLSAAARKSWHTVGSNRPHTAVVAAVLLPPVLLPPVVAAGVAAGGVAAAPKNREAHSCLKGPGWGTRSTWAGDDAPDEAPADVTFWGKKASARSFHVMTAATVSTRLSEAPVIRASAPP